MKDFFGHPITIGATIAWPVRRGAKLWMNSGSVTNITDTSIEVIKDSTQRATTLRNASTVISMRGVV